MEKNNMDKWELSKKLREAGYEQEQVRRVWAYSWNEQHVGRSGKKRIPWELKALNELSISAKDIEFGTGDNSGEFNNYF
jgi:hypothetical protein